MWASHLPDDRWLRLLPFAIVAVVCLWGLISPLSQWPVLWRWGRAHRHVIDDDERASIVRRSLVLPLIVSIVVGALLWPQR